MSFKEVQAIVELPNWIFTSKIVWNWDIWTGVSGSISSVKRLRFWTDKFGNHQKYQVKIKFLSKGNVHKGRPTSNYFQEVPSVHTFIEKFDRFVHSSTVVYNFWSKSCVSVNKRNFLKIIKLYVLTHICCIYN